MPTLEFQAIVNSLQSAIFTPGNLVTVSAVTTQANIPVLDLTVNQIDTDSFTIDTSTTPPTLRITAHPEQSPWHSPIDAAGFYLYDLQYLQFADGTIQTTAFNAGAIGQSPWLQDVDAAGFDLDNLASVEFVDGSRQITAYLGVGSNQTPWLQQINAAGNNLINVTGVYGKLLDLKPTADHAAYIYDVSGNLAWVFNSSGELSSQHRGISNLSFITFGDLTTQTTAYKGIVATQTPWITNIDAAGHSLSNVAVITCNGLTVQQNDVNIQQAALNIVPFPGANAFRVYDTTATLLRWYIDNSGNLFAPQHNGISDIGSIRFADNTVQTTAFVAGVGAQTPWASNINGGGFTLTNVSAITATNITTSGGALFLGNSELTIVPKPSTNAFLVYNPGATAVDWLIGPSGHLSTNSGKQIFGVAGINFADATVQTTAFKGIAATQTPWLQEINGNGQNLNGAASVVIWESTSGSNNRFGIINAAFTSWHWKVDTSNNLISDTGREIITTGVLRGGSLGLSGGLGQVNGVAQIQFTDASTQNTAYKGVAANQTPWLQNIQGARKSLDQAGLISIWPLAGQMRFGILNEAGDNWEWQVDANGNMFSGTGRSITGLGTITTGTFTTTGIGVMGGNLNWSSAPANGDLDTALSRVSAGILRLYGPAGSEGDLYLRNITASGGITATLATVNGSIVMKGGTLFVQDAGGTVNNAIINSAGDINSVGDMSVHSISASGGIGATTTITAANYVSTANAKTALWDVHAALSFDADLRWSNDGTFYGPSDLMLRRHSAGGLQVWNPSTGVEGQVRSSALILGTNLALYQSANGLIIDSQALGARARVDCGLLFSADWVHGTGFVASGEIGLGDSATTGPFEIQVTTPSGAKSLWFMGGILYAVT